MELIGTGMVNDAELIRCYAESGSEEAFRLLTSRYANFVFSTCKRKLKRREWAEDATVEVFILFAQKAKRMKLRESLASWLYRASLLVSSSVLKREGRIMMHESPLFETETVASFLPELRLHIDEALTKLAAKDREVILLRYFLDLSITEVAAIQGTAVDAARMRIERALERMKRCLAGFALLLSREDLSSVLSQLREQTYPAFQVNLLACSSGREVPHNIWLIAKGASIDMLSKQQAFAGLGILAAVASIPILMFATRSMETKLHPSRQTTTQGTMNRRRENPNITVAPGPNRNQATVYDRDGKSLGTVFYRQKQPVPGQTPEAERLEKMAAERDAAQRP